MENRRDLRLDILKTALKEPQYFDAEDLLHKLDVLDPFRDQHIVAWETEDPLLVVWGTHDLVWIVSKAQDYYLNEIGLGWEELHQMDISGGHLKQCGRFRWGHPQLRFMEHWPDEFYGDEQENPHWVPFYVGSLN